MLAWTFLKGWHKQGTCICCHCLQSPLICVTMITFKKFQRYSVIGIKNMNNGFRMTWIINFFLHNKDEAISYNFVHGEEPCLELDGPTFLSRLSCHISSCFLQSELINSKRKQSSRNNYKDIPNLTPNFTTY